MNEYSFYGAVIGDIAGSYKETVEYKAHIHGAKVSKEERIKILDTSTSLFSSKDSITDDSVLTLALAHALLTDLDYEKSLRNFGNFEIKNGSDKYGRNRFGNGFVSWLKNEKIGDSFGNGCAMRISPIGYAFETLEQTLKEAELATIPSHNHPHSVKCAKATAGAIYLARNGNSKEKIKDFIEKTLDQKLDFDLAKLQEENEFDATALGSVPNALFCFFESNDFEDAIRKALSIGGDTDTIACITGSVAGAYYGVPENLVMLTQKYISDFYLDIINNFTDQFIINQERYNFNKEDKN